MYVHSFYCVTLYLITTLRVIHCSIRWQSEKKRQASKSSLESAAYRLIDRRADGHLHEQFLRRIARLEVRPDADPRTRVISVGPGDPNVVHLRLARHICKIDRRGDQFRLVRSGLGQKFVDPIEALLGLPGHGVGLIRCGHHDVDQSVMLHRPRPAGIALGSPFDRHCGVSSVLSKRSIRNGSIGKFELPWVTRSAMMLPTIGPSSVAVSFLIQTIIVD